MMARPLMPVWLYRFMGNLSWRYSSGKWGNKLKSKPFADGR
jgi:hypothetical protein